MATYSRTYQDGAINSILNIENLSAKDEFQNMRFGIVFGFGANFNIIED